MAFAAAISGGVALQQEDIEKDELASKAAKKLAGNLRLFDLFGIGGGLNKEEATSTGSESRFVREHTEASILIALHDELSRTGQIKDIEIGAAEAGDLVSASVGPAVSPLRRVVDQIIRLFDVALPVMGVTVEVGSEQPDGGASRQARRQQARELAKQAVNQEGESAELRKLYGLFLALQDDLDQSGMIDVVVRREGEPSILLTLDKRFASDQTLELLHTSRFKVIGKITHVWPNEDEAVDLYRRSVMSLVPALSQTAAWGIFGLLISLAKGLNVNEAQQAAMAAAGTEESPAGTESTEESTLEEEQDDEVYVGNDVEALHPAIMGPAIQILPLAICT